MFKNKVISVLMVVVLTVLSTFVVYGAEESEYKVGSNDSIYSYLLNTKADIYNETGFEIWYKGIEEVVFMDLDANSIDKYLDINNEVYNKLILDVETSELKDISLRSEYDTDKYSLIGYIHMGNKTMYVKDDYLDLVDKVEELHKQKWKADDYTRFTMGIYVVIIVSIIYFSIEYFYNKQKDSETFAYRSLNILENIFAWVFWITLFVVMINILLGLVFDIGIDSNMYDYLHTNLKDSLKLLQIK